MDEPQVTVVFLWNLKQYCDEKGTPDVTAHFTANVKWLSRGSTIFMATHFYYAINKHHFVDAPI